MVGNDEAAELSKELEVITGYCYIQNMRFGNTIRLEIDVPQAHRDFRIIKFILQPIVENSLLHGLKNKGYSGLIRITALQKDKKHLEIQVSDTGSGFAEGKKEAVEQLLKNYTKHAPKLTGNSIGVLNVQKRIKLFCGKDCGLSYTENENGGLTAHLLLSMEE